MKHLKNRKIIHSVLCIILLVVGICLLSLPSLENFAIHYMTNNSNLFQISQKIEGKNDKNKFNFKNIKSVNAVSISKAILDQRKDNVIGKLSIPDIKINLPIFYGLENQDLLYGVGTMKPNQVMGVRNYVIAGHHMENEHLLLGSLYKLKKGNYIYITDGNNIYIYKVFENTTINRYQTHYVTDEYKHPTLTILTCTSGELNEPNRTLVRATLIHHVPFKSKYAQYFK